MEIQKAVDIFGSKAAIARALGLSQPAVTRWGEIIPKGRALELEKITNGALKCDLSLYRARPRKNKRIHHTETPAAPAQEASQ